MRLARIFQITAICALALSFAGHSVAEDVKSLVGKDGVYLLVNQHPDENRARMYSVNYQLPSVLPVCTKVKIEKITRKAAIFTVPERGNREYSYLKHKSLPDPFETHLAEIFGTKCPKDKIAKMSKTDQEGIKAGVPMMGMTKAATLIAMGPPPKHVTYSTDLDEWTYWKNRFGTMRIQFENNKIKTIIR